jgi:ApbE superfamily uncharacterized protein (UPF0280 family)
MAARRAALPSGGWHFQHGPIDVVIGAEGDPAALAAAQTAAWQRFETILTELVDELPVLRRPVVEGPCPVRGPIARRMWSACLPFCGQYITPMAAVAGSVAEELVAAYARPGIERAWINDGGDIALHLAPGRSVRVGLFADLARFDERAARDGITLDGRAEIGYATPVRGIATSGWRGRSFSLGIADSVTVFARTASAADAAATVVANAVDVDDPRIVRRPASTIKDDSDLGELPVTVGVPVLDVATVERALQSGLGCARELVGRGLAVSCTLTCQGRMVATDATAGSAMTDAGVALADARRRSFAPAP